MIYPKHMRDVFTPNFESEKRIKFCVKTQTRKKITTRKNLGKWLSQ